MRELFLKLTPTDASQYAYLSDPISVILEDQCFASTDEDDEEANGDATRPWRSRCMPWRSTAATDFVRRLDAHITAYHDLTTVTTAHKPHTVIPHAIVKSTGMTAQISFYLRHTPALAGTFDEAWLKRMTPQTSATDVTAESTAPLAAPTRQEDEDNDVRDECDRCV